MTLTKILFKNIEIKSYRLSWDNPSSPIQLHLLSPSSYLSEEQRTFPPVSSTGSKVESKMAKWWLARERPWPHHGKYRWEKGSFWRIHKCALGKKEQHLCICQIQWHHCPDYSHTRNHTTFVLTLHSPFLQECTSILN